MKKIALLFACAGFGLSASAQISITGSNLTYTQDFNTLDTLGTSLTNLPSGWSIYEWGSASANTSYRAGSGSSNAGDTYSFGSAGSSDRALGSIASGGIPKINYGAVFINNTGVDISSFDISFKQEQWRSGDTISTNLDSVRVYYSTSSTIADSNFTGWTEIPALMMNSITPSSLPATSGTALNGNTNFAIKTATVSVNVPNGSNLAIRWYDFNSPGSDDGNAIDSLTVIFTTSTPPPPNYKPNITALDPADNSANVPVSTTDFTITFDRAIAKGTGNINIKNETDQTIQTIDVTTSAVTVSGNDAVVSGIILALGKDYHVTFDSSAFDTAGYKSYGIYDTTAWSFSTAVGALNTLAETFDASCPNLPLGWSAQSIVGTQNWHCAGGNTYLEMNGFSGGANDNEDWLITPELDLSAVGSPMLYFQAYKGFNGSDLDVLTSTNYSGTGDPNLATWTSLQINFSGAGQNFDPYSSALPNSAGLYIAFKYVCTSANNDCAQWRVDSVYVNGATTVLHQIGANNIPLTVLGEASTNNILLGFSAEQTTVTATVYDLTGRVVYSKTMQAKKGANRMQLNPALNSGTYIIRISDGMHYGVTKALVH